jgi:hypothetical protein
VLVRCGLGRPKILDNDGNCAQQHAIPIGEEKDVRNVESQSPEPRDLQFKRYEIFIVEQGEGNEVQKVVSVSVVGVNVQSS